MKKKILFVCTVNRMRSATASRVFGDDQRFLVKGAGTDPEARQVLNQELVDWTTSIVVMEKHHRNFIRKHFPEIYHNKRVVCLYIPDDYDFMQAELVTLLKSRFAALVSKKLI